MSAADAARQLADCPHAMPIRSGAALRCPFCGAMKTPDWHDWVFPHLVAEFVREWRKERLSAASSSNPDDDVVR